MMIEGKTASGFVFSIADENLDNMELIDALADVDSGKIDMLPRASLMLLGENQRKKLYDHIRTEKGNVPIEAFMNELEAIMEATKEGKNS